MINFYEKQKNTKINKETKMLMVEMDLQFRIHNSKINNNFSNLTGEEIQYLLNETYELIEIEDGEGGYDLEWLFPYSTVTETNNVIDIENEDLPF